MLGLPEPSERLTEAIEALDRVISDAPSAGDVPIFDALLATLAADRPDETELDGLGRRVLLAMMEERRTREPVRADR